MKTLCKSIFNVFFYLETLSPFISFPYLYKNLAFIHQKKVSFATLSSAFNSSLILHLETLSWNVFSFYVLSKYSDIWIKHCWKSDPLCFEEERKALLKPNLHLILQLYMTYNWSQIAIKHKSSITSFLAILPHPAGPINWPSSHTGGHYTRFATRRPAHPHIFLSFSRVACWSPQQEDSVVLVLHRGSLPFRSTGFWCVCARRMQLPHCIFALSCFYYRTV